MALHECFADGSVWWDSEAVFAAEKVVEGEGVLWRGGGWLRYCV